MDRIQFINYQGKKIIYLDFSNLKTRIDIEMIAREAKKYIHAQPVSSVYSLTNITDMHFNNEIKEIFTELAKSNKPYVKTGAIVGVTGLKQILFNGVMLLSGRDLKCFSTLDQAKNWLVKQN